MSINNLEDFLQMLDIEDRDINLHTGNDEYAVSYTKKECIRCGKEKPIGDFSQRNKYAYSDKDNSKHKFIALCNTCSAKTI